MAEWVAYLREEKLWGNDDPLFPSTRIALGAAHQFEAVGLGKYPKPMGFEEIVYCDKVINLVNTDPSPGWNKHRKVYIPRRKTLTGPW
ncbi:MAG: hypothetical protein H0V78_14845 [Burkholderiales bacterium]|nr:hypothetical protein [Burkholderiales bacterium]